MGRAKLNVSIESMATSIRWLASPDIFSQPSPNGSHGRRLEILMATNG